jgi:hypothetical protein
MIAVPIFHAGIKRDFARCAVPGISDLYLVAGNDQERSIGVLSPSTGDAIVE